MKCVWLCRRRRRGFQAGQRTSLQLALSYTPESYHAWNHGQKVYLPKGPKSPLSASVSCSNDSYANNLPNRPSKETGRKGEEIRVKLASVEEVMAINLEIGKHSGQMWLL